MIASFVDTLRPQAFTWQPYQTLASSPITVAWATLGYLLCIGTLSWACRKALPVPKLLAPAHNLLLCLLSSAMFIGTLIETLKVRTSGCLLRQPELDLDHYCNKVPKV